MSSNMRRFTAALLCLWAVPASAQVMGSYPFPSFIAGTTAVGEQVTSNFNAIKSAVNAYDATIKAYADASSAAAAAALVPAGAVLSFNLAACPTGWHELDGTGGFVDARGRFVRALNVSGSGLDPSRALASTQADQLQNHVHPLALQGFGVQVGATPGAITGAGLFTLDPSSGNHGAETRPANIAFRLCQKT